MNIGIAGEVRVVVSREDGSIKQDTGYQKNIILNQGLDFFGGAKGSAINDKCAIGAGNIAPVATQTSLVSFIAITSGTDATSDYAYVNKGDNLYRMWEQKRYRFEGLNNVNINEVGLASQGTTQSDYYLTTRALIKDTLGQPTTITVKLGETLDVYYKIHKVVGISDNLHVVNMLDGNGGSVPYNVVTRPAKVGSSSEWAVSTPAITGSLYAGIGTLGAISNIPSGVGYINLNSTGAPYQAGSYKRVFAFNAGLNLLAEGLNVIYVRGVFFPFQMSFNSVASNSPIPKTNKNILELPYEISWGRYEGAL